MAIVTSTGSRIMTSLDSVPSVLADPGEGGGIVRKWVETVETGAADSGTSTYLMARLPSNARIMGSSKIAHDALGATTTTMSIGVFNLSGKSDITDDADAINTGIVCSTAGTKNFVLDPANFGLPLWDLVSGETVDPKCLLDIKLTLDATNLSSGAGTVTVEIDYCLD